MPQILRCNRHDGGRRASWLTDGICERFSNNVEMYSLTGAGRGRAWNLASSIYHAACYLFSSYGIQFRDLLTPCSVELSPTHDHYRVHRS